MTNQIAEVILFVSVSSQILTLAALIARRKKSRNFDKEMAALEDHARSSPRFPGISVVTSLKGNCFEQIKSGVECILDQKYDGPLEFVIVLKNEDDPAYARVQKVIREHPSSVKVRVVLNPVLEGANPRSAKMAFGFNLTTQPWIYWHCVDSVPSLDHFRQAMQLTKNDSNNYVTVFPVNTNPRSFGAKIETVGLNLEVTRYFLLSTISKSHTVAYGGSTLFHRDLLKRAGGLGQTLDRLTDDEVLAQAFKRQGARCYLAPHIVQVSQENISLRDFWKRQVRWFMIGKYHLTHLFVLTPFFALGPILLLMGLCGRSPFCLKASAFVFLSRMLQIFLFEVLLEVPKRDRWNFWVMPFYDVTFPIIWFFALIKKQIDWGGTVMTVTKGGVLKRPQIQ